MKFQSPIRFVGYASVIITLFSALLYICLCLAGLVQFSLAFLLLFMVLHFTIIFFFLQSILRDFLTEKIKLIYKTIHNLKLTRGEKKSSRVNLKDDVLGNVDREVNEWASLKKNEIEELRQQENFRREFLGNVSHELKTPLFNIQGYVSTLLSGAIDNPDVNHKYLEKTEANIDRMVAMVEELSMISGLETGELRLNTSRFSIQSLALEVINHLEDQAAIKNITLSLASDNPVTFMVVADRDKYRQVFTNLLSNSIRYGILNGRTKISLYDMGENILVEVSDNGIGVDTQHLSRLFERFYRVDKSRAREDGGSGLGLAIVKHIVEAHEQTVNVRSTPGLGSTFSFTVMKA